MKADALQFNLSRMSTPIGEMLVVTDPEQRLRALDWQEHETRMNRLMNRLYKGRPVKLSDGVMPRELKDAFEAYFAGLLNIIDGLDVVMPGTAFQQSAWRTLREIPSGATLSYGEQAARMGRPNSVRAVGAANGANPVGLVVPCHRVIGANGALTGYGGGLERKRWLLQHEGALEADEPRLFV
ncbi:MAG: methylated-DNA--[protein]-cysteine S-methyltransferase [Hyphomicrobiales bacterium]|nr:methylated-DNA--[protein]-cysteine S-methyltransferase [Hyphomicrobiales bacterium]